MFEVFFMNEKIDNTLNIALNLPEEDLEKSQELSVGIENDIWELIIRYQGDLDELSRLPNVNVRELSNGYAIITTPKNLIDAISNLEQIIFIEKPKRLEYSVLNGKRESCINQVQQDIFLIMEWVCLEKALLLALLTVESITPIRFLEIRTEVREF